MPRSPAHRIRALLRALARALRELGAMHMGMAGFPAAEQRPDTPPLPGTPPPPGHPERLCEPAELTEQERALARQLWP